jgi:hypothetical protein
MKNLITSMVYHMKEGSSYLHKHQHAAGGVAGEHCLLQQLLQMYGFVMPAVTQRKFISIL